MNYVQAITYPWVLTPTDYTYEMGYFKHISPVDQPDIYNLCVMATLRIHEIKMTKAGQKQNTSWIRKPHAVWTDIQQLHSCLKCLKYCSTLNTQFTS